MAASNTLSTVNAYVVQRRGGVDGCGGTESGFPSQQQQVVEQDLVRLHSRGRETERSQSTVEFMNRKDACRRKKKVNKTAKPKQCKLDVQQEQWVSQHPQGKSGRVKPEHRHKPGNVDCAGKERTGTSGQICIQGLGSHATANKPMPADSPAMNSQSAANGSGNECKHTKKDVLRLEHFGSWLKCFENAELPAGNEQIEGSVNGWCSIESKSRSNSSCTSTSYTGSGSEDDENRHDAEDDWEAAFDMLHIQGTLHKIEGYRKGPSDQVQYTEGKDALEKKPNVVHHPDLQSAQLKPEYRYKNDGFGGRRGNFGRAWRPEDISRPPTLPRLVKQHTKPSQQNKQSNHRWGSIHGNMWGPTSTPSYCPICTEELDVTDSSYIPCDCGFQLCLFCYHRIASDDGRCPGCRKAYSSEGVVKLSHSSNVWLHVSSI